MHDESARFAATYVRTRATRWGSKGKRATARAPLSARRLALSGMSRVACPDRWAVVALPRKREHIPRTTRPSCTRSDLRTLRQYRQLIFKFPVLLLVLSLTFVSLNFFGLRYSPWFSCFCYCFLFSVCVSGSDGSYSVIFILQIDWVWWFWFCTFSCVLFHVKTRTAIILCRRAFSGGYRIMYSRLHWV